DDVGPGLLRQKVDLRMQDWWAALEKQVLAIYAAAGTGKAAVSAVAPPPAAASSDGATAAGADGGALSIKLIPPVK
ncbi:MAG: hypothetical protein LC772_07225, partial [Chloroflexi bacterium]|nr:hypothetical protein [Chloroflexota bacterium]